MNWRCLCMLSRARKWTNGRIITEVVLWKGPKVVIELDHYAR
jgi:hypothetical protein